MSAQIRARLVLLLGVALLSIAAAGQEPTGISALPHPYAYFSGELNGGGYEPVAFASGAGLDWERTRWFALAETSRDNARKQDSGTGRGQHLQGRLFYRLGDHWYAGAGAQWSKLTTDLYSKQAWRPTFGVGRDWLLNDFSMRGQVMYVLPGTDHLSASQGPEISIWIPSPKTRSRFFFRETVGIYEFHQTATPSDPGTENRSASASIQMGLMFRF
jgi:hypothetical protein